jgi:hypothetical protein
MIRSSTPTNLLLSGHAFADNLSEHADLVFSKVEQGIRKSEQLALIFAEIAQREIQYHNDIEHQVNLFKRAAEDEHFTEKEAIHGFLMNYLGQTKQHKKFGQLVQMKVCAVFKPFVEKERKKFDKVKDEYHEFAKPIPELVQELNELREKCTKLINSEEKSIFKKGNKWEKILQLSREFDERRVFANQYLNSFYDSHLCHILTELQRIEEKRIAGGVNALVIFSSLQKDFKTSLNPFFEKSNQFAPSIDIRSDIESFVQIITERKDAPDLVKYIPYSLPMQLLEMERQAYMESSKKLKKPLIELTDLPEQILNEQVKLFPDMKMLTLPRIFLALKRAVEDLGGLEKEGIFRISSEFSVIDSYYEKIRSGDYDVDISDPHVAANCLKKWLREMKDSLFFSKYADSIMSAIDISERDFNKGNAILKSIFDSLPNVNQLIIKGLLRLMRDISYVENVVHTKMTMQNLAVVFAPSFLRSDELSDPKKAIKCAQISQTMILTLASIIALNDYPIDNEIIGAFPSVVPIKARNAWKRAPLDLNYAPSIEVKKMGNSKENKPVGAIPIFPAQKGKSELQRPETLNSDQKVDSNLSPNEELARKWSDDLFSQVMSRSRAQVQTKFLLESTNEVKSEAFSPSSSTEFSLTSAMRINQAKVLAELSGNWNASEFSSNSPESRENEVFEPKSVNLNSKIPPKRPEKKFLAIQEKPSTQQQTKAKSEYPQIVRVARCLKCQAKATNRKYCLNCWSPLEPSALEDSEK